MTNKVKEPKEQYLKVPYHILNLDAISLPEKILLAHIYSFGKKGCWQSNNTLAKIFNTSPGTVSRWITKIKKYLYVKCPKGYHRTLWAKSHPDVREAAKLRYRGRNILKNNTAGIRKNDKDHEKKRESDLRKFAIPLTQKCATTNNTTNKETIKDTIEPPSPLLAGGQAPAALEHKSQARHAALENFKIRFGHRQAIKKLNPLSEAEFHEKARLQRKALLAAK